MSPIIMGFYLCQADPKNPQKQYYAHFRSILLNNREHQLFQPKLKLYGLFHALCAYKIYIISIQNLIVKVDAIYIRGMLNNLDIAPSASVNHWIVSIFTFHFKLQYVPEKIYGPDGLSC